MKHILIATFLAFLPMLVSAEESAVKDFAHGYILETDDKGAIYSLSLPHEVYTGTVMNNLEDLRVFNSEGQLVPHELRYPTTNENTLEKKVSLPFFPLFTGSDQSDPELSMRIETGSNGEIVSIQKNSGVADEIPSAYLIDMKEAATYPLTLNFKWNTQGSGSILPVVLDSSEDLVYWRRVKKTTLADLIFMNNRLHHGEIELPRLSGRYLRLKSENRTILPELTAVDSISGPESKIERRWIKLPLSPLEQDNKTYLQAEVTGGLPVDSLTIKFNQPNSLLKARVLCLDDQNVWCYRGQGLFYKLSNNGDELINEALTMQQQNISALRLEIIEDGVGSAFDSIELHVGYVPQEILFIARGKGPFTLAYGNASMMSTPSKSNGDFLKGLTENGQQNLLRKAELKEKVVLGGEEMLKVPKEKPWNKIVLWLVLIAGVATLAVMAWSLTRKMNH
ncbi:MAG: DUF3999 domain-containing protein [Desulfamplus sp.]|nr:DUF3999 domain-containing protein [Desulfamplus sp.]